ncbi:peptidoglycan-binding domain-containing protein [Thiocystis minor]|uniref:peptidoglycan-binding domain-containing protein n=1 Tax=Thiocystis minor TaxID=61597 RepID=UPI0019145532|nr:peptidoglycan-binding domain-containing protein [Thiocystis minor]
MRLLLRTGSSGQPVRHLQSSINFLQIVSPPLAVDGIFGPKTQAAVIAFQRALHLTTDGIVGPLTGQALAGTLFLAMIRPAQLRGVIKPN